MLAEDVRAQEELKNLEDQLAHGAIELRRRIAALQEEATSASRRRLGQIADEVQVLYDDLYQIVARATHETYEAGDVKRWCERSVEMGCEHPVFNAGTIRDLIYYRRVPNEKLREAYLAEIEHRTPEFEQLGSMARPQAVHAVVEQIQTRMAAEGVKDADSYKGKAGADKLARVLGIRKSTNPTWGSSLSLLMPYEAAAAMALALGLVPSHVGV